MSEDIQKVKTQVEELAFALEALGIIQQQHSAKMGIAEKAIGKFKVALKKNPISVVARNLLEMGKAVGDVTKFVANSAAMSVKEREESYKKMTIMQKLATQMFLFGGIAKMNNKILNTTNNRFTRLTARVFALVGIFLVVGFALAALSLALDGTNSDVLNITEDMGPMHDAMQGLALIISGEGDEGLAALFDILAVSILGAAAAMAVFNGRAALIIGAGLAIVGTYQLVKNETGESTIAMMGAAAVALGLAAAFYLLRAAMVGLATGTMGAASLTVATILGGFALIFGGLVGLYMYMTGAGEGLKGFLLGLFSVIAIAVGAFLLGIMSIPIAVGLALVFLVATIMRYWEETKMIGNTIWGWIKGFAGMIWYGLLAGLALVGAGIGQTLAVIVGVIVGAVNGVWSMLKALWNTFWKAVKGGWTGVFGWLVAAPGIATKALVDGFKDGFNSITDIYNKFAGKMTFDIPAWVPVVGGKEFNLPLIPKLAKGGIVNSPTLAMIGEDGPEAVVPLSRRNNPDGVGLGGGGGITVNINVGGVTDRTDKKQLAREIGDLVRAEMARSGRSYGNRRSAV